MHFTGLRPSDITIYVTLAALLHNDPRNTAYLFSSAYVIKCYSQVGNKAYSTLKLSMIFPSWVWGKRYEFSATNLNNRFPLIYVHNNNKKARAKSFG